MSKRLLFYLFLCALVGAVSVWRGHRIRAESMHGNITDAEMLAARKRLGDVPSDTSIHLEAIPQTKVVRLAIGGLGLPDDSQNRLLGDLTIAGLSGERGLELVERRELGAVMAEQQLNLSGLVRARDAVHAGKLLHADWFLMGTAAQINRTNCLVVRLVDAQTGVTRDGTVFVQKSPPALASEIAEFIRQSRKAAAEAKPRIYLAIGTFEDISVNDRQADFPAQARGYLTAAYQHSRFILLERDQAEALVHEMELDLAGFTESRGAGTGAVAPSSFWLVNGTYESYETTNIEIEVSLEVQRIFGSHSRISIIDRPGEPICRRIKDAMDGVLTRAPGLVVPNRVSEIRAQMAAGKELLWSGARMGANLMTGDFNFNDGYLDLNQWHIDPQRIARRKHNIEEAIRAFNTILLLDPSNNEARMHLALCLRYPGIDRLEEARGFYREIIEDPRQDGWVSQAKGALEASLDYTSPSETAKFFESALRQADQPPAADFYRQEARKAEAKIPVLQSDGSPRDDLAKEALFESLRSFENVLNNKPGSYSPDMGMADFAEIFGADRPAAAERLAMLYPEMKAQYPDLTPYLLATLVHFQPNTNAPIIADFQAELGRVSAHPDRLLAPEHFWPHVKGNVLRWSFKYGRYDLAAKVMEAKLRNQKGADDAEKNDDRLSLGYAYLGTRQWQKALETFESFSNQIVQTSFDGPWGPAFAIIYPEKQAAYCREKLGLPPAVTDPREFKMGPSCFCFCSPSAFTVDETGIWIGINGQLIHLDFNLMTNATARLPVEKDAPVSCLCPSPSSVWIGTDGGGLLEFDRKSGKFRRLTQNDGLLMDKIASLHLSGDTLWIGYGRAAQYDYMRSDGGLGKLDLSTGRLTSFTPHLPASGDTPPGFDPHNPPRHSVTALADGSGGEIWFITDEPVQQLRRFTRDQKWERHNEACTSVVSDSRRLVAGKTWNYSGDIKTGDLGVSIFDFESNQWQDLKGVDALTPGTVKAVALDHNDLWIGGFGYVAAIPLSDGKPRKYAHIQGKVDEIQIGGGWVWAKYNGHLHRASLSDAQ